MNNIIILISIAGLSAIPNVGWCYGIETHKELTKAAANASALGNSDLLSKYR